MNYGSVCSGIEAAGLAWRGLVWNPLFVAEAGSFLCAVLSKR